MGLIVSGAGVGYLPKEATKVLLSKGKLQEIKTKPALPSIVYVAMFPDTMTSSLESFVLKEMRQCCDFTKPIFRGKSTAHK